MPGDSLILVPVPRFHAGPFRRAPLRARAALAIFGIGCLSISRAETALPAPVNASPANAPATPVAHVTDAQDRLGDGKLRPSAEKRSKAGALFARATLLAEGPHADLQEAISIYRQVVELEPDFVEGRIKLANLLLQTGQLDMALAQLESSLEKHPKSVPLQVALGYTQRLRGQDEEALRYCKRALAADPTQIAPVRVMLEIAADQNDLAGGVLHVGDIFKYGGENVPAASWLTLARFYVEVARNERTPPSTDTILRTRLPILQQAAAKTPPDATALTLLADTCQQLGRKEEALRTYRRALALQPANVDLTLACAGLEGDLGNDDDALADYEKAYALNPAVPGLRERLCGLYVDQGIAFEKAHHPDKAQACFQKIFNSIDCPEDAYLKLAAYQIDRLELKQAAETLAAAEARFPQSPRVRFCEAVEKRKAKDYAAALACLDQVRALSTGAEAAPLEADYYLENAQTMSLAGRKDRLEPLLREGLGKYPDNPDLMNGLAYFWAEQGSHLPEALALSQRAVSLKPGNGPILDTYGWVYFQMGQPKDALPYLQRAALITNNDPVVLQHVGDTYLKLGLRREAIATWTRALEKDPSNGDLATRIAAAQAQANNAPTRSAPTP